MIRFKLFFLFIAVFLPSISQAFLFGGYDWQPLGTFTIGPGFSTPNQDQTLTLLYPWTSTYKARDTTPLNGMLGLNLGAQTAVHDFMVELGISAYFHSALKYEGDVWQFSLPEFNNFSYRYQVQTKRLMATTKVSKTYQRLFHPYILGEMGTSFNHVFNYYELPYIPEAVPMEPFAEATNTSLAWGLGLGVDVELLPTAYLGVGYEYLNNGRAKFNPSPSQLTAQTLGLHSFYTQQILFQLTVLL